MLYISRKLSKRETMYSTIEKECLAIRWAVLTLRYYLLGREFTLALAAAPPHERYQRADHPLVSGITTLQIQGDPQAGDVDDCGRLPLQKSGVGEGGGAADRRASRPESGGGGMWQGGRGSAKSAAGERLRRRR